MIDVAKPVSFVMPAFLFQALSYTMTALLLRHAFWMPCGCLVFAFSAFYMYITLSSQLLICLNVLYSLTRLHRSLFVIFQQTLFRDDTHTSMRLSMAQPHGGLCIQ